MSAEKQSVVYVKASVDTEERKTKLLELLQTLSSLVKGMANLRTELSSFREEVKEAKDSQALPRCTGGTSETSTSNSPHLTSSRSFPILYCDIAKTGLPPPLPSTPVLVPGAEKVSVSPVTAGTALRTAVTSYFQRPVEKSTSLREATCTK